MSAPSYDQAVASTPTSASAVGGLQSDVSKLAPLATSYHTAPAPTPYAAYKAPSTAGQGALQSFLNFAGGVAHQIGNVTEGVAGWVKDQAVSMAEAPIKYGISEAHGILDNLNLNSINTQRSQLDGQMQTLTAQYKSGQISKEQYTRQLNDISQNYDNLVRQSTSLTNRFSNDYQEAKQATIDTSSLLLTVLTGGFGKATATAITAEGLVPLEARTAGSYLASGAAKIFFGPTEDAMKAVAAHPQLFDALAPGVKQALQQAVGDVVATGAKMTSGQIARAAAANLAFKYPITYWYTSSTADQLYHELDNKQYGAAVQTAAFNAALLLSGGPIGYGLRWLGKGAKAVVNAAFLRSSFIDELSKGIGNGQADGLWKEVTNIQHPENFKFLQDGKLVSLPAEEVQKRLATNLSALEATNMQAAGKDPVAAAWRVLKGMAGYEGISMKGFTHEEALINMSNFAEAQRAADEAGKALGTRITVGRVDARDLEEISAGLTGEGLLTSPDRLQAWENLKLQNPNKAWAHNENFDRQIKSLVQKYGNENELDQAIRNIKAQFRVEGFPASLEKTLSEMGYIPIKPQNLEAPFTEGAGKVASRFAQANSDIFTKAVQPVPVLSWLGGMLTKAGLSPFATTERVYQLFNDNLARNLQQSGVVQELLGENINQTTDTLIKQLSSYMHNPTAGKLLSKAPVTDLRMLTTKDIMAATGMVKSDARLIQEAIARSFIQVPLAARGLGDRAVDLAYGLRGTAALSRRYLRIQGALRYSWNPFFQYLRVIPKTETLTEFEGGGFLRSVFSGRFKQMDEIRQGLRAGGFLEQRGGLGNVISGEAVDFAGSTGHNLTHKLLPMQERSIAGLVDAQAQRMGMDWQTYLQTYPDQARDTIQMIAQYDKRSDILNSPLMRTLNVAVFPLRFDTKVAMIMGRNLGKASLMTQVAVVKGLMDFHQWMNSDQGKAWYAQNADIIGLFKYVSPVAHLNELFSSLVPGNDHSLGNFGEIGGLPFGFITQLLDSEGITHFNQAGADPKTGELYSQYLPASDRGQIAIVVQDFLGSLFSYPGATVGSPSKTKATRTVAMGLTGAKKSDFNIVVPPANAQQLDYQQALQRANGTTPNAPLPAISPYLSQQVPQLNVPTATPVYTKRQSAPKKKKKSEFTPELLPGQTTLGQL